MIDIKSPRIFNLGTRRKWAIIFRNLPFYFSVIEGLAFSRRCFGISRFGHKDREAKIPHPYREPNPGSSVLRLTEPSWLCTCRFLLENQFLLADDCVVLYLIQALSFHNLCQQKPSACLQPST
jgi:hypothetical protein